MKGRRAVTALIAAIVTCSILVPAASAQRRDRGCGDSVVLRLGETIPTIADRCGLSVEAIMAANPLLPSPYFVFPGMRIRLPPPPPPPAPTPPQQADTHSYVVLPGDTLSRIARNNDVSLSDIYRLNPDIDARSLRVGDILLLPGGAAPPPGPPASPRPQTNTTSYVVQPGDTLFSIARANDMRVRELLDLNPGLDPRSLRVGDVIVLRGGIVPPSQPSAPPLGATITPASGAPGDVVDVAASGFQPSTTLRLLSGSDISSLQEFQQVTTDRNGNASVSVRIPDWAAAAGTLVFAYETLDGRLRAVSNTFQVTSGRPGHHRRVTVTGTLTREGVECQAMRGDDGALYTLTGNLPARGLRPGDRVRVVGRAADVSFCQQGTTIDVESFSALQ